VAAGFGTADAQPAGRLGELPRTVPPEGEEPREEQSGREGQGLADPPLPRSTPDDPPLLRRRRPLHPLRPLLGPDYHYSSPDHHHSSPDHDNAAADDHHSAADHDDSAPDDHHSSPDHHYSAADDDHPAPEQQLPDLRFRSQLDIPRAQAAAGGLAR